MKKVFLFPMSLILMVALMLALLVGCGATGNDASTDASPTIAQGPIGRPDGEYPPKNPAQDPINNPVNASGNNANASDGSDAKDTVGAIAEGLAQGINPTVREVHDMNTNSLVADYLSGAWDGGHSLYSADNSTFVAVYADGSLSYNCQGVVVYHSDKLRIAKFITDPENRNSPIPNDYRGEKVFIDLPEQKLPEDAWTSSYVIGEGAYVQDQHGVTLYYQGKLVDSWEIEVHEHSFLATRPDHSSGQNFILADDQLLQLVEGGTTKLVYDHVADAGWNPAPFVIALTLEDGTLTERHYWAETGWEDEVIAEDVADARLGLGGTIFCNTEGKAFVTTPAVYYYEPGSNIVSLGYQTLDEVEMRWTSYCKRPDTPILFNSQLEGFIEACRVLDVQ